MKTKITFIIVLFLGMTFCTFSQTFDWASEAGGNGSDQGYDITIDENSNSYVGGYFSDTAYFDSEMLISVGSTDVFVAKYDSSGVFQWVVQGRGPGSNTCAGITSDENNNVFITGWFSETMETGETVIESYGSYDMFVIKINSGGDVLWAKSAGGISDDYGNRLTINMEGDVIVSGTFREEALFGEETYIESPGDRNIFIANYSNDGNFQWVKNFGGKGEDRAYGIECNPSGDIYFTGFFNGICFFGDIELFSPSIISTYTTKLNPGGEVLWAKKAGGGANDFSRGFGLGVDDSGNAYATGFLSGNLNFIDDVSLHATGGQFDFDNYIVKYNTEGDFVWAKNSGSIYMDQSRDIFVDGDGYSYITGFFSHLAEFGQYETESIGMADVFVAKYDPDGIVQWARNAGGTENDYGYGICANNTGSIFISGVFTREALFGSNIVEGWDDHDIFIAKIVESGQGIKYSSFNYEVKLFPNPNNGIFKINISSVKNINKKFVLRIFNPEGKIVYIDDFTLSGKSTEINVNLKNLANGIYNLEIHNSDGFYSEKFILNK
ncbi:MAG: SBBP repeat-containing protein [Bacteroidales bacterium]|nr:SBBP repeat-containing protein [Bacteroidales bacterium]